MFNKKFHKKFNAQNRGFILFQPMGERVSIDNSSTTLDVARRHNIDLPHSCGGMGSCTTCRVILVNSPAGTQPRTALEKEIATERNFTKQERLACQLTPTDGMEVYIPNVKTDANSN